jgi:sugar phosphate permease
MALVIMGIVVFLVGMPLSFLFRTRPEDYGMVPDGKATDDSEASRRSNAYDFSTEVSQALKMRAFWFLCLINMLQSVAVGAIDIHSMPYLVSLGIARSTASVIAMAFPLVSLPARFGFGWMGDLFKKNYMLAVALALQSLGLLAFSFVRNGSWFLIVVYIVCYGISLGGLIPLRAPITREYFGARNFGTIFGLVTLFSTAGSVVGAPLAGWVYDTRGTYYPIWLIFSGTGLAGALLALVLLPASRPSVAVAAEKKLT